MTKENTLVSVIIPAFNAENFIGRAISSVLNQIDVTTQIIVVDDGSTDKTPQILLKYDNIISIRQNNKGAASARNYGVSMATGNYIAFLDADDEWLPNKLELQIQLMEREGSNVCLCDLTDFFEGDLRVYRPKPSLTELSSTEIIQLIFDSKITRNTPTLIFKTELTQKIGGFNSDLKLREDHEFLARLVLHGRLSCLNKSMVNRYVYSTSLSNSIQINNFVKGSMIFYKIMLSDFPFLKTRYAMILFFKRVIRLSIKKIINI